MVIGPLVAAIGTRAYTTASEPMITNCALVPLNDTDTADDGPSLTNPEPVIETSAPGQLLPSAGLAAIPAVGLKDCTDTASAVPTQLRAATATAMTTATRP